MTLGLRGTVVECIRTAFKKNEQNERSVRRRAYHVGGMEANCLHLDPGGDFPFIGGELLVTYKVS